MGARTVWRWPGRPSWRLGLLAASALTAGYLAQTEGMVTVSPGVAGLLTGLFVVFTPLLDWLLFGARVSRTTLASVVAALVGPALLTGGRSGITVGDGLVAVAAVCFAAQIVFLSRNRGSVVDVSVVQILVCALVFLPLGTGTGLRYPMPRPRLWRPS